MLHRRVVRIMRAAVLLAAIAAWGRTRLIPIVPIRVIAPFAAGGLADLIARAVCDEMSRTLGQPVIVENRVGAGGNTGAADVARTQPDGYTLLMASSGILTANPFLYSRMPFDVETAFAPVSNVADMPVVLVVHPNVEATSLKELIAFAGKYPGKLNFGSAGIGTNVHLGLVMLMRTAAIEITHVPYKGAGPAVTDLLAGQIDGILSSAPTVMTHIHAGNCVRLHDVSQAHSAVARRTYRSRAGLGNPRNISLVWHSRTSRHVVDGD